MINVELLCEVVAKECCLDSFSSSCCSCSSFSSFSLLLVLYRRAGATDKNQKREPKNRSNLVLRSFPKTRFRSPNRFQLPNKLGVPSFTCWWKVEEGISDKSRCSWNYSRNKIHRQSRDLWTMAGWEYFKQCFFRERNEDTKCLLSSWNILSSFTSFFHFTPQIFW